MKYLNSEIEISIEEVWKLIASVNKAVLYIHENYIYPVIAEELPYRINFSRVVRQIRWCIENNPEKVNMLYKDICLLHSYMDVAEELSDIVLQPKNVRDSIRAFQDLISQYIDDKKVCVTPKGLSVYFKENEDVKFTLRESEVWEADSLEWEEVIFGDDDTELALNNLSSGECKIIMLAFYATFAEGDNLIMDEPELSISILWQNRLIRDLLDYGQFQSIIVATHSPYIARDVSLAEFIEYLP